VNTYESRLLLSVLWCVVSRGSKLIKMSAKTTERAHRPPPEVIQSLIDTPDEGKEIFDTARQALMTRNRIDPLEARLEANPNDPKLELEHATVSAKIAAELASIAISTTRIIVSPAMGREHLKWKSGRGVIYDSEDSDSLSPDCYALPHLQELPDPYARFLVAHADLTQGAIGPFETSIREDPTHKYHPLFSVLLDVVQQGFAAHNYKVDLKEQADRPKKGFRSTHIPPSTHELLPPRPDLIENALLMMQPLMAADIACARKGITDRDEVMNIILNNISLFISIINTTGEDLPYCLPRRDKEEFLIPYAGTFRRFVEVCTEGEGRMKLDNYGTLKMPADISKTGRCPLTKSNGVRPPQDLLEEMDEYHQGLSEGWNIPLAQLRENAKQGFASSFFFHFSLVLARDTFLGKSAALAANPFPPPSQFLTPL